MAIDRDEYQAGLVVAYAVSAALQNIPLAGMVDAIEHAHAIGPIVDPTLYRNNAGRMVEDGRMLGVLLRAQRELAQLASSSTGWDSRKDYVEDKTRGPH